MNYYLFLIKKKNWHRIHVFNTFFFGELKKDFNKICQNWSKRIDLFSKDYVFIPIHLTNHWALVILDFKEKKITYYDSLGGKNVGCTKLILEYVHFKISQSTKFTDPQKERNKWTISFADIPKQTNGYDCGVFVLVYCLYLSENKSIDFTQKDMLSYREKILEDIFKKHI